MKLKYDNYEDAKQKLAGTYCYYKGKAVTIKLIDGSADAGPEEYILIGNYMASGRPMNCKITDPEFNCSDYNIGYVNMRACAAWFYRIPMKQYRQGLRHDQVQKKYSVRELAGVEFGHNKHVAAMLENVYPTFNEAAELLRAGEVYIMAFHKNFAMTYDKIHDDLILEYKGDRIGFTKNSKELHLMEEFKYLAEALKEATN